MEDWEDRLSRVMERARRKVGALYDEAAEEAARMGASVPGWDPGRPFEFASHARIRKAGGELVDALARDVEGVVVAAAREAWALANERDDEAADSVLSGLDLPAGLQRAYYGTNPEALEAFLGRKSAGLSLSERVWRYAGQFRAEIEDGIDVGLRDGLSAQRMASRLKAYLREPGRLYRRVRDERGQLRLSRRAAAYHPGRGVYRSSFQNARRLAATETNMAYRTADWERWQGMDFVEGMEIRLSNNHNCKGVPRGAFRDVCDDLAGRYPKDFKWTGWHPFCRCYAVPILQPVDEFLAGMDARLAGEACAPSGAVADVPDKFKEWVEGNRERAKGWEAMPYFIKDNEKYTGGLVVNTYDAQEKKFTRARSTKDAMSEAVSTLSVRYPEIPNTELAAIYHFTRGDVSAFRQMNAQLRKGTLNEFNAAFAVLIERGLQKIDPITATTYRTMRLNRTWLNQWLGMAEAGETTTFSGFSSSSLDRSVAEGFAERHVGRKNNETDILLVIEGKSGRPIEGLSQFGTQNNGLPNQREVLFIRGRKFRITGCSPMGNNVCQWEFFLEEV